MASPRRSQSRRNSDALVSRVLEWEEKQEALKAEAARQKREAAEQVRARVNSFLEQNLTADELLKRGHKANGDGNFVEARTHFLKSFELDGKLSSRISASNMSKKAGDYETAISEYQALLDDEQLGASEVLTPKLREMVEQKLAETKQLLAEAEAAASASSLQQWQQQALLARERQASLTSWQRQPVVYVSLLLVALALAMALFAREPVAPPPPPPPKPPAFWLSFGKQ